MASINVDDLIFDFAYELAMRDATLQRAFPATDKKILWQTHSEKDRETDLAPLREGIKAPLRSYIKSVFNGKPYDFYVVANKIQEAVESFIDKAGILKPTEKGEEPSTDLAVFTFGNTQKLINMTVKYLFMATYDRLQLRGQFEQCHCPMDGIMEMEAERALQNPKAEWKSWLESCTKQLSRGQRKGRRVWKDDVSWSALEWKEGGRGTEAGAPDEYLLFQAAIKELAEEKSLNPIEYDFYAWSVASNEEDAPDE